LTSGFKASEVVMVQIDYQIGEM